ncbi:tetratricopeptide repeat protein [Escherichia coli]|uniref:tetratricopeptide repeat protein n=1 Tax=Escherichia coli TaxID=562 RepID=UPI000F97B112|nr:hypothetical protein [Escherichia coli]EGI3990722.1 hypothetical protein [Escherichia coli]EGI4002074.1 hypothetical protein [Escherichia coli]EGI4006459.1 hypothetical protein [Escherichia coli]EGI4020716.1 hypothetical protein [Escherichia coli]EGI4025749.1 hypothetical protein [Escherichia coli]
MLSPRISRLSVIVFLSLISANVNACGPFIPNHLLTDRNSALLEMPNGSFVFEVQQLAKRDPGLPIWHENTPAEATQENTDDDAEPPVQNRSLEIAQKLQKPLSDAQWLYYSGAKDFHQGKYDSPYFQQLLALPKTEQGEWRLAALYSLARGGFDATDDNLDLIINKGGFNQEIAEQAIQRYQQIIEEVRNGVADPEQLSLASLGQIGHYYLKKGDVAAAVKIYARQAAQGSPSGKASLRMISLYLTREKNLPLLESVIDDPLVQQLVIAELFIRHDWGYVSEACTEDLVDYTCPTHRDRLIKLLSRHRVKGFSYSDRLAALAYRAGNYSLAQTLLEDAPESGLSEWLKAKMALRAGDIPLATRHYARAVPLFPTDEMWGSMDQESPYYHGDKVTIPSCRIASEQAILALKRDDYLQAAALFYQAKDLYWADLAWVAENVLTLPELQAFVEKNVPVPQHPLKPVDLNNSSYSYYISPDIIPTDVKLRALLGRQLIRHGQYQQAINWFDIPNYRQAAQKLADLMAIAKNKNIPNKQRAQAQYEAARLLRFSGIELVAYEMYPDYAITSGQYSSPFEYSNNDQWISRKEKKRIRHAIPTADDHFLHYRWQAAEWAGQSADLLHPKTQAWAAVLCHAASWVRYLDPETGALIYQRYVKNGKSFDWTAHFGRDCPEPVFKKDLKK